MKFDIRRFFRRDDERPERLVGLTTQAGMKILCGDGYRPVIQCPEVQMCIGAYADAISSMTIHLMRNGKYGDTRIRNELSRKLDINPCRCMTRQQFIWDIVYGMLAYGNKVVIPEYRNGYLDNFIPLPPDEVTFEDGNGSADYIVVWRGKRFSSDEVLHFVWRPDLKRPWKGAGYQLALFDVVKNIRQANSTRKALLESPHPSIIVKVDGLTEEFASVEGRKALSEQYLSAAEDGHPWFIPAEAFGVDQVRPLTMTDLAIKDSLELDKRAVAAIFSVPASCVGIGAYNKQEHNDFVKTEVMAVAKVIEQELTRKLLIASDLYWRFNNRSLLNYDIGEIINVGSQMLDRVAMTRNELRDWIGMEPRAEMEELVVLENYIPADRIGDQKKLNGGGEKDGKQADQNDAE